MTLKILRGNIAEALALDSDSGVLNYGVSFDTGSGYGHGCGYGYGRSNGLGRGWGYGYGAGRSFVSQEDTEKTLESILEEIRFD